MSLPRDVAAAVDAHLGRWRLRGAIGGGCIHPAYRLGANGRDYFLKYGAATPPGFFAAEAEGLRQLREATELLRVPEVIAFGDLQDDSSTGHGWLLLEWLEPASRRITPAFRRSWIVALGGRDVRLGIGRRRQAPPPHRLDPGEETA